MNPVNLILVILDDMSLGHLSYLAGTATALEARGFSILRFRRAYTTTPVCCPARASLLRGEYAHRHGIRFNREIPPGTLNGGARAFTLLGLDQSTVGVWLRDAGYTTHLVGKYLNGYEDVEPLGYVPPGWDNWRAIVHLGDTAYGYTLSENGTLVSYGTDPSDYMTDVLARLAVRGIRRSPSDRPLFLVFAPFAPHAPGIPAPRHAGLYPGLLAPRNPAYNEADVSDKPAWVRGLVWTPEREAEADARFAGGARTLQAVNDAMEAMLAELEATGRLADTFLLVTNDNGTALGEHRWLDKTCPYEACVRVPLLAASARPDLIPAGGNRDALAACIDLPATLAEIAGAVPAHPLDGVSLVPLLASDAASVRGDLLIERWAPNDVGTPSNPIPTFDGVVNAGWKYVELYSGERELYPLAHDRFELENWIDRPENAFVRDALADRLDALRGS